MAKTVFDDTPPSGTIVTAAFLNAIQNHRHDGLDQDGSAPIEYAVATGSDNAFVLALSPALLAHTAGLLIRFKANHSISGAATVNINGLGAIAIKKQVSTDLISRDIVNGQIVTIVYDGTYYQAIGLPVIAPGAAYQDLGTNSGATGVEWYNGVRQLLNAKGAMVYASAANTLAKLAIGAANLKLFVNAAGDLPEWSKGLIVKAYTRANNGSSGDVSYTGVGFKPSALIVIAHSTVGKGKFSVGLTDFTTSGSIRGTSQTSDEEVTAFSVSTTYLIAAYDGSTGQTAVPKSADNDGFTLTWSSHGSPESATINIIVLALR